LLVPALYIGMYCVQYLLFLIATPRQNTVVNRKRLDSYGGPFALYLRSYSLERSFRFTFSKRTELLGADRFEFKPFPDLSNTLESSIVNSLAIPTFALSNRGDLAVGAAIRIEIDSIGWQSQVEAIADRAALIIVNIEGLTPAIEQELSYLEKTIASFRTVILASSAILTEVERLYPLLHRSSHKNLLKGSDRSAIGSLPRETLAVWGKRAWEDWLSPDKPAPGAPIWIANQPGLVDGSYGERIFRASDCRRVNGTRTPEFRNPLNNARRFLEDELYWFSVLMLAAIGVSTDEEPSFTNSDLFFVARNAAREATASLEPTKTWSDSDVAAAEVQIDLETWLRALMRAGKFAQLSARLQVNSAAVFDEAFLRARWRDQQALEQRLTSSG
jgi:hypothetical protein